MPDEKNVTIEIVRRLPEQFSLLLRITIEGEAPVNAAISDADALSLSSDLVAEQT